MSVGASRQTRIRFLAPTRDEQGRTVHHPGEVITGELLARKHDFLLVRANSGVCMYVDTTRTDLYSVETMEAA